MKVRSRPCRRIFTRHADEEANRLAEVEAALAEAKRIEAQQQLAEQNAAAAASAVPGAAESAPTDQATAPPEVVVDAPVGAEPEPQPRPKIMVCFVRCTVRLTFGAEASV